MTITVVKTPPFATVQDLGWTVGRAWGLPRGGAMDPVSLTLANLLVGNLPGAAALEWALGPGELEFAVGGYLAVTGPAEIETDGRARRAEVTIRVRAGDRIRITPKSAGRFVYVAIHTGIDVPALLGSRSTYLPARLGGLDGRRLEAGDVLPIGAEPAATLPREGTGLDRPAALRWHDEGVFGIIPGPHYHLFSDEARGLLGTERFTVAPTSDRMGIRVEGPQVLSETGAALPSEATCVGSIQIPSGGAPIVLMPDGPTVGGYPQVAVVIQAHLSRLAQQPPGTSLQFRWLTLGAAKRAAAEQAHALSLVGRALSRPAG